MWTETPEPECFSVIPNNAGDILTLDDGEFAALNFALFRDLLFKVRLSVSDGLSHAR